MCINHGIPHKVMTFLDYHISDGMTEKVLGISNITFPSFAPYWFNCSLIKENQHYVMISVERLR